MSSFLTAPRMLQIAIGAGGLAGGALLSAKYVGGAFEKDHTGPQSRIVYDANGWIVDQPLDPQGQTLTKLFMGGGAIFAGIGAAMTMGHIPLPSAASMARSGVGALLFAGGVGIVAGAISSSMQWTNTAARPS